MTVTLEPFDGWGFKETIDGTLAPAFRADIDSVGVEIGDGIRGWRGRAIDGKYAGAELEITPRNDPFGGPVVLYVTKNDQMLFSGIAYSSGLERTW